MEDKCLRCGKCCYGLVDGILKPCPYLKKLKNGKTRCVIYKKRLGTVISRDNLGNTIQCGFREETGTFYPGCPLNPLKN